MCNLKWKEQKNIFDNILQNKLVKCEIGILKSVHCLTGLCPHRIDANVEDTQLNVEAAHTEILKYFQSVSSNRWLMIKIFLVLVVFFIIFVVFFA